MTSSQGRISKTDNGVKTCYYYQGSVLLYTTDSNGNKTSQNIIGPQENIIATIRYEEDGQTAYFYNKDIRTSVTNVVDDAGQGIVSYYYDDYGTWNMYAYCGGNPINHVDPSGHMYNIINSGYYYPAQAYDFMRGYLNKNNKINKLTEEQKLFVAVIAGEAIGENEISWKAVAHVIMNRVSDRKYDFKRVNSVTAVIKQPYQFQCYQEKSREYKKAKNI